MVEYLLRKPKTLSANPRITKIKSPPRQLKNQFMPLGTEFE
jgi:hypothetical protein